MLAVLCFGLEGFGQTTYTIAYASRTYKAYTNSVTSVLPGVLYYTIKSSTVFVNPAGNSNPIVYPNYYASEKAPYHNGETEAYGHTSTSACGRGNVQEVYQVNNASVLTYNDNNGDRGTNLLSYTYTPVASDVGTPIPLQAIMTGWGDDCSSNPDKNLQNEVIPYLEHVTVEAPAFVNQATIASVCQNQGVIQIADYFSTATNVTFNLDNASDNGPSITSINPANISVGKHILYASKAYDNGTYTQNIPITVYAPAAVTFGPHPSSVCSNSGIFNIQASPAGGTWSGTAIDNNGNFTPSSAGIGSFTETYNYTDPNKSTNPAGCTSTNSFVITVQALPSVQGGQNIAICQNGNPVSLTDGSPSGGTWSGQGVSNNSFNPSSLPPGNYTLSYTVTNSNGCSNTATKTATVQALPTVNAGPDISTCSNTVAFDLSSAASPSGGSFSGTGVSNNSFDPGVSGVGSFTVTYNYQDQNTLCTNTAKRVITVKQAPAPVAPPNQTTCKNAAPIPLQGGTPTGGTYSGVGVSSNIFTPANGVSGNNIIYYTYTDPQTNCIGQSSFIITVTTPPVVSGGSNFSICQNSFPVSLTDGSPSGGTWSGQGVSNNSFNPSGLTAGQYTIIYSYTDGNGCGQSAPATKVVTINAQPVVTGGANFSICQNAAPVNITGGSPAGGTWSGQGTSSNTFNPSGLNPGNYTLVYAYTDGNGCSQTSAATKTVTINLPPVVSGGSNFSICKNGVPISLTDGTPTGGTWSGQGVTNNTFNPSALAQGQYTLTYFYSDGNGCSQTAPVTKVVTVNLPPVVSGGSNFSICQNGVPVAITDGSPGGGTWSGQGVSSNTFNPSGLSAGQYTIIYFYTDGNGCSQTAPATKVVTVNTPPVVAGGVNFSICQNASPVNITGGLPTGGTWSGPGVSSNTFNPSGLNPGQYTLTYSYTDVNGCSQTAPVTKVVTVNLPPVVSGGANFSICQNATPVALIDGTPAGGTWSGQGVTNNSFVPSTVSPGQFTLLYTYSDGNGCAQTAPSTKVVTVNLPAVVSGGSNFSICQNAAPVALTDGTPINGTWSGPGVINGTFSPATLVPGQYTLTYSYTDGNGCSQTAPATKVVTVLALPVVYAGKNVAVCVNSAPFDLTTDATPAGGTFTDSGSGTEINNNNFNPNNAGVGTFTVIYTYQAPTTGCTVTATKIVTVKDIPYPISPANMTVCLNDGPFILKGATPTGGVYTGQGVTNGTFSPLQAGTGVQTIIYTYQDPNTLCTGYNSFIITVKGLPVVDAGRPFSICINGGIKQLSGTPFNGKWSGAGTSGLTFDPSVSGAGKFVLTYTYQDPNTICSVSDTLTATVMPLTILSAGVDTIICQNSGLFALHGTQAGGVWSGRGVSGNNFNPILGLLGENILTYTFTNTLGCTSSINKKITLLPYSPVTVGNAVTICLDGAPYDLTKDVNIQGGVWSGQGVNGNFFTPSAAGVGTFTLTYTLTNGAGCVTWAAKPFTVLLIPAIAVVTGTISGANGSVVTLQAQSTGATNFFWYHLNDTAPFATGAIISFKISQTELLYCIGVNQLNCGLPKVSAATVQITSLTPSAAISSSLQRVPFGGLVSFTATDTYNVKSYKWNFGDSSTSSEQNPPHYFYKKGSNNVSVTLTSPENFTYTVTLCYPISVGLDDSTKIGTGNSRPTGIDSTSYNKKIFPSPFKDHFYYTCHLSYAQTISMKICDTYGRQLKLITLYGVSGDNKFRIDNLDSLVIQNYYIVLITSPELSIVIKTLKM